MHTPGAFSLDASGALGLSEKTFLNGNKHNLENETETTTVPSLDDFDKELEIFRVSYLIVLCKVICKVTAVSYGIRKLPASKGNHSIIEYHNFKRFNVEAFRQDLEALNLQCFDDVKKHG